MPALQRFACALFVVTTAACASSTGDGLSSPSGVPSVNPSFVVNADKAAAGWQVWADKACLVCHAIGGRNAGPDLMGLVERRDIEWIKRFMANTEEMLETDPISKAMLEEYRFQKMPNMKVTEQQVENLIHYIQRETNKKRASD